MGLWTTVNYKRIIPQGTIPLFTSYLFKIKDNFKSGGSFAVLLI